MRYGGAGLPADATEAGATLDEHLALPDTIAGKGNVGELLAILNGN